MNLHSPHLFIATLLPAKGRCGVQTHFNAIAQFATTAGLSVSIVTPFGANRWLRRIPGGVGRVLNRLCPELAVIWNRAAAVRFLCGQLRQALKQSVGVSRIIYAQDPLSAKAALKLRQEGLKFRLVCVLHFNISEASENVARGLTCEGGPLWRRLMATEKMVLPQVDSLIFVSDFMRRVVQERLPELATLSQHVIHNFPLPVPDNTELPKISGDLLAIGTLEPRKNQEFLLQVLAKASQRGHRYTLTLAGDGEDETKLRMLAAELGIAEQVTFAGFVPGASRLLPTHRALVHAAQMENMPLTLIEAFSHEKTVLAPAVGGIPEIFSDGIEGRIWPLDDPDKAAEYLIRLLEDRDGYSEKCRAAGQRYVQYFHPDVLGPRWLAALQPLSLGEKLSARKRELNSGATIS